MAEHFLDKVTCELSRNIKGIRREALDVLMNYRWPGNVRELENIMDSDIILQQPNTVFFLMLSHMLDSCNRLMYMIGIGS